jgi:hypothetical protein
MVVTEVKERLAINKQGTQIFDTMGFNLKKRNEVGSEDSIGLQSQQVSQLRKT